MNHKYGGMTQCCLGISSMGIRWKWGAFSCLHCCQLARTVVSQEYTGSQLSWTLQEAHCHCCHNEEWTVPFKSYMHPKKTRRDGVHTRRAFSRLRGSHQPVLFTQNTFFCGLIRACPSRLTGDQKPLPGLPACRPWRTHTVSLLPPSACRAAADRGPSARPRKSSTEDSRQMICHQMVLFRGLLFRELHQLFYLIFLQ